MWLHRKVERKTILRTQDREWAGTYSVFVIALQKPPALTADTVRVFFLEFAKADPSASFRSGRDDKFRGLKIK